MTCQAMIETTRAALRDGAGAGSAHGRCHPTAMARNAARGLPWAMAGHMEGDRA